MAKAINHPSLAKIIAGSLRRMAEDIEMGCLEVDFAETQSDPMILPISEPKGWTTRIHFQVRDN